MLSLFNVLFDNNFQKNVGIFILKQFEKDKETFW